ncbi:MAG: hypothetical protein ACO2OR_05115 [Desulfurococcaceae archaeon]
MSQVYVFEAKVVRFSKNRYIIYPPGEYQLKLEKFHGKKVKVLVVIESN